MAWRVHLIGVPYGDVHSASKRWKWKPSFSFFFWCVPRACINRCNRGSRDIRDISTSLECQAVKLCYECDFCGNGSRTPYWWRHQIAKSGCGPSWTHSLRYFGPHFWDKLYNSESEKPYVKSFKIVSRAKHQTLLIDNCNKCDICCWSAMNFTFYIYLICCKFRYHTKFTHFIYIFFISVFLNLIVNNFNFM